MRRLRARLTSLRMQISLIVVIAWLAPTLVLGGTIISVYFPALRGKTQTALVAGAQNAQAIVLGQIQHLIGLAKDVTYDGELTSYYSGYQAGTYRYQEFYRLCKNYLERRFSRNELIGYAAFFPINAPEQFMFTGSGYPAAMFFHQSAMPQLLKLSKELDTMCHFLYREDGQLYLVRNLYNYRLEIFGMLVINVNYPQLFSPLYECARDWSAQLSIKLGDYESEDGPRWDEMPMGLTEVGDDVRYRIDEKTRDYDFRVLVRQSKAQLYAGMDEISRMLILLLLALVPVCVLVVMYLHRRVFKPVQILSDAAGRIEGGELGVTVPMQGGDELGRLGSAFSGMSVKLAHLVDTVYKEQIALRDAQLQAMQSRINPHFINNALELINWQARMDGESNICQMVEALSVLMNAALDRSDRRLVALSEELSIADAYLYFLAQRFGQMLTIERHIDPEVLAAPVPRLAIQMLLENAAEHGIAPSGGGPITLAAYQEDAMLVVEVRNGGRPLSAQDQARIQAILSGQDAPGNSVGLKNVKERLALIYMGRAQLTVKAERGQTVARMRVPMAGGRADRA